MTSGYIYTQTTMESTIEIFESIYIYISVLFTIAKNWDQPSYPSTDAWIMKFWYETLFIFKEKCNHKIFKKVYMDLKYIILNEVTHCQKGKHVFSLFCRT